MNAERVTRVVTLPVRAVADPDGAKVIDAFRPAWRLATELSNWCQLELVKADPGLTPPGEGYRPGDPRKLSKYEPKCLPGGRSLYQHVTTACPLRRAFDGAAGSMGAVLKAVEDTWARHKEFGRFAVLAKGSARPAVFRFPAPWPVRAQELRVYRDAAGRPHASLTLPGGRVKVRLADGPEFRRQLRQFDLLLADVGRLKQAKVTGRRTAGRLVGADLRLVGAFDAAEKRGEGPAALIRTDPHALFVVEVEGRRPWLLNFDHLRRLQAAHRVFLQRFAEDLKHEKRVPSRRRAGMEARRAARCEAHRKRLDSELHQASAQVAGYCGRAGVSVAVYDDAEKGYVPDGFPWAALRGLVAYKLAGVGVEVAIGGPPTPDEE